MAASTPFLPPSDDGASDSRIPEPCYLYIDGQQEEITLSYAEVVMLRSLLKYLEEGKSYDTQEVTSKQLIAPILRGEIYIDQTVFDSGLEGLTQKRIIIQMPPAWPGAPTSYRISQAVTKPYISPANTPPLSTHQDSIRFNHNLTLLQGLWNSVHGRPNPIKGY